MLGSEEKDDKEIVLLGRRVRWTSKGIEFESDPRHREAVLEYFGFDKETRVLTHNGDKDEKDEECELEDLERTEAKEFRSLSARMNFMGQDGPDLQFPVKGCSKEMASPKIGSWKRIKRLGGT